MHLVSSKQSYVPLSVKLYHWQLDSRIKNALVAVMVIIIGYLVAQRIVLGNPWSVVGTVVLIPVFLYLVKHPEYALLLLPVTMTSFFGLYPKTAEELSIPLPLGRLFISDVVFLLMVIPILRDILKRRIAWKKVPLNKPIIALFLLVLFQVFRALFLQSENLHYVLRVTRPLAYYSIFFLVLYEIKSKSQLDTFLKLLFFIGVICGVIAASQPIFRWSFSASRLGYDPRYGVFRTIENAALPMITFTFLVLFSILPYIKKYLVLVLILACEVILFFGFLFSFYRSVWGSVAIAMVVCLFLAWRNIGKMMKVVTIIGVLLIIVMITTGRGWQDVEKFFSPYEKRASTTVPEVVGQKGSVEGRILLFKKKWDLVERESVLLGVGFKYGNPNDPSNLYAASGADSSIAHMIFRFGIIGAVLFGWIFWIFFKRSLFIFKRIKVPWYKGILIGLMGANIQLVIHSAASGIFFSSQGIVALTISWALTELIWKLHSEGEDKVAR